MATVIAIPSGRWFQLPGTKWEVYQDSGEVALLGDDDIPVRIRRVAKRPAIWGPRTPVEKICRGLHCKCMNLDGSCSNPHNGDHNCRRDPSWILEFPSP